MLSTWLMTMETDRMPVGFTLYLEDYHPSVLLHCWLGHLTFKIVSEMTYNVSSWTLNPRIQYHTECLLWCFCWQAWYFDRDDVALKGFHKFFKKSSEEEREHAEKMMKYQNSRGGRLVLQPIDVCWSLSCMYSFSNYYKFCKVHNVCRWRLTESHRYMGGARC